MESFICPLRLLWPVIASLNFHNFDNLGTSESNGQIFSVMPLSLGLSDSFLMGRLELPGGEKTTRLNAVLLSSYQKYILST